MENGIQMNIYSNYQNDYEFRLIFRQKVSDFLHLALLKDFVYVNISLGVTLAIFSGGFFYALQPMYLYELNISKVGIFIADQPKSESVEF